MFAWQRRLEKKHEASPKNEANIALPHTGKQWSQMETALRKRKPENIAGMESLMQELHGETPKFGYKALERAISEMGKEGEAFFKTTLPFIQSLVLELPRCFTSGEMRILRQNHAARVRLSCRQCAVLLACAFFQLLPEGKKCPKLCFGFILDYQPQKIKCILHYFNRASKSIPLRNVDFYRRVLVDPDKVKPKKETKLLGFEVKGGPHVIEDCHGALQADFANEWIGGGVLHGGCVQEEILFVEKPECLCSLLFCQKMLDGESITIIGAERFSTHTGYGRSFKFAGDYVDETPIDSGKRLANIIVCYDAIVSRHTNEFQLKNMRREFLKTFVAVDLPQEVTLSGTKLIWKDDSKEKKIESYSFNTFATGNWGCGAFGGTIPLKAMLQWIGASEAGRDIVYMDFSDKRATGLPEVTKAILKANKSSHWLWHKLVEFFVTRKATDLLSVSLKKNGLFPFLFDALEADEKAHAAQENI